MKDIPLGKKTDVPGHYAPWILYPITRIDAGRGVHGFDLWRCYELSWIGPKGTPEAAMLEIAYPVESENIVESKSLKLYLGSLADTKFSGSGEVRSTVAKDLEKILRAPWVETRILELSHTWEPALPGTCIDELEAVLPGGEIDPDLLVAPGGLVEEKLVSHLLKTSCPITGQPDWATVRVDYRGPGIDPSSLLAYLCSYRSHSGFGEECCSRIFRDISGRCAPEELTVALFYTRRGGIDINPVRSSRRVEVDEMRRYRLPRQ
jgi:7-cyano-7-deazaguanine reductase